MADAEPNPTSKPLPACSLCSQPGDPIPTHDAELLTGSDRRVFMAVGFRVPGHASDALPVFCASCRASLLEPARAALAQHLNPAG